ncbi:uracil-DNA glycosylase family protein [Helicobacter sp.]|uniref:uracil-DNA glycosylase family protein n=1 Tax=Helicobacter sp. TaxID=218 RepID=UPI0025B7C243|nr:uracil-DNA glycosylase family protein [Helicobacter sp.]MCI5968974.1 uracil-DNA glycosylase [Helicobacter sp.]MDY2584149.1 uracil-DNA glycosylase family protein [Helicobacter sp.]
MQTLHQALLLKKLHLLQSCGFSYCEPPFLAPTQQRFQSQNSRDLKAIVESCKLCAQKSSEPNFGLCHQNSKLVFVTLFSLFDRQMRFGSKASIMLKNIIEGVFKLSLREVSILSLLKCEIPKQNEQESVELCMGYFLKQLEFCGAKTLVVLGSEVYYFLTKDRNGYNSVQGKLLKWNHYALFPTFALSLLVRQPELKINAHKEFLELKRLMGEKYA